MKRLRFGLLEASSTYPYLELNLMLIDFVAQQGYLRLQHAAQERSTDDLGVRSQHNADGLD